MWRTYLIYSLLAIFIITLYVYFNPITLYLKIGFSYLISTSFGFIIGFLLAIFGIKLIINMRKIDMRSVNWNSPLQGYIKGWAAAIGFTLVGVLILIFKILGKM